MPPPFYPAGVVLVVNHPSSSPSTAINSRKSHRHEQHHLSCGLEHARQHHKRSRSAPEESRGSHHFHHSRIKSCDGRFEQKHNNVKTHQKQNRHHKSSSKELMKPPLSPKTPTASIKLASPTGSPSLPPIRWAEPDISMPITPLPYRRSEFSPRSPPHSPTRHRPRQVARSPPSSPIRRTEPLPSSKKTSPKRRNKFLPACFRATPSAPTLLQHAAQTHNIRPRLHSSP